VAEFTNPNQSGGLGGAGGGDNKSLVLMMIVMVGVFFGLQYYRQKTNPSTAITRPTQSTAPVTTPPPSQPESAPAPGSAMMAMAMAPATPAIQASAESTTVVENELYRITFSNRGGQVLSWLLKSQKDADGKPLDLVHHQAAEAFGHPLSLYTYDPATTAAVNQALYVPSSTGILAAPGSLSFHYAANGLDVTKIFSFDETYLIHADVFVTRNGVPVRALISWPGGFGDEDNAIAYNSAQLDTMRDSKEDHIAPKKISNGDTLNGPFEWVGVSDMYFATIFLPDSPSTATVATLSNQIDVQKTIRKSSLGFGSSSNKAIMVPVVGAAFGDISGHTQTRIYAGPKLVNVLRGIHPTGSSASLEPLLDFGFFGPIGKYLFLALQFIHSHVTLGWAGSWGWAIVFLTIIINLIILPAARKDHAVRPQDAAHPAPDGRHQGKVQEVQGHRSQTQRDERRDHEASEGQRRQHVRWLHPHPHPDAAALRLLRYAA
jgi:YidC/Oxa1 family membrane protein insertase